MSMSAFESGDKTESDRILFEAADYAVVVLGSSARPLSSVEILGFLPEEHRNVLRRNAFMNSWADASSDELIDNELTKRLRVGMTGDLVKEDQTGWVLSEFGQEMFGKIMGKFEEYPTDYPHMSEVIQATIQQPSEA